MRQNSDGSNWLENVLVAGMLLIHALLLGASASLNSPTHLEPAFLAAGVSHWQLSTFELYRVNPPLPRMVAALPVVISGCRSDWSGLLDTPGSRSEFAVGRDFVASNLEDFPSLLRRARWVCGLFSLLGAFVAWKWSRSMYGAVGGTYDRSMWCPRMWKTRAMMVVVPVLAAFLRASILQSQPVLRLVMLGRLDALFDRRLKNVE